MKKFARGRKNSGSYFHCFRIELKFRNVGFYGGRKTGEITFGARTRTNNKLDTHTASPLGIKPGPHWWGECSCHCHIPASRYYVRIVEAFPLKLSSPTFLITSNYLKSLGCCCEYDFMGVKWSSLNNEGDVRHFGAVDIIWTFIRNTKNCSVNENFSPRKFTATSAIYGLMAAIILIC